MSVGPGASLARLVIGTTNRAKVVQMRAALASLELQVVGVSDLDVSIPVVDEDAVSAEATAATKALAYTAATGEVVLSLDHWLHLDGVDVELQPRGHVRRIPGWPSGAPDDVLIDYYSALAASHGGSVGVRWDLGVALARASFVTSTTIHARRTLVATASPLRQPGMPISSLQIDPTTGRYVSEEAADDEIALWQRVYGQHLHEFVAAGLDSHRDR